MSTFAGVSIALWIVITTAAIIYISLRIERIERLLGITEEKEPQP